MKVLILIFAGIFICLCSFGQTRNRALEDYSSLIGIDVTSVIIDRSMVLHIGHAFSRHWSIHGSASLRIAGMQKSVNNEETGHYMEFGKEQITESIKDLNTFNGSFCLSFWPKQSLKGMNIRVGLIYGNRNGPDCRIGAGYMFRIWKMVHADISYEFDILEARRERISSGTGLRLGINILL